MDAPEQPDYGLIDRIGIASAIFYPRPTLTRPPEGASNHAIETEDGAVLAARLFAENPDNPTLLYFHGNGEVASDYDGVAPFFHAAGLNLFVADFRGYGGSSGVPTFETLVADGLPVAAAVHAILDGRGFAPGRFIMGRSLGSQPALEIAARAPEGFAGLIIESGAASLSRLAAAAGSDEPAARLVRLHEAKIASVALPALVIHGERDELIPVERAIELHGLLGSRQKELLIIPGAGHNDIFWVGRERYLPAIMQFVEACLGG